MLRGGAKLAPLKLVLAFAFDVGHNHGQHLFVNVNSRYSVSHTLPPGGSEKRAATYINQGRGLSPLSQGRNDAQLFAQSRTLRIRQTVGLDLSIARSTSPLQPVAILLLSYFHEVSRAAGPTTTNRKQILSRLDRFPNCTTPNPISLSFRRSRPTIEVFAWLRIFRLRWNLRSRNSE